jgi:hypothetical protein
VKNLNTVTFSRGEFVAVGDAGTIVTSSDGEKWVLRESGVRSPVLEVDEGNGILVAIGNLSSGDISQRGFLLASGNGFAWKTVLTRQIAFTHLKFQAGRVVAKQFGHELDLV